MSRFKTPRFNTRNWEKLAELDESRLPHFEKLHHSIDKTLSAPGKKPMKARQQFQRER